MKWISEQSRFLGIFITLILISLLSCHTMAHKKAASAKNGIKKLVAAGLRHGACYGRCPEYKVMLNASGLITYTGIRNVEDTGIYERNLDAAETKRILSLFEQYRVDTCKARYPNRIVDLPSLDFYLQYADTLREIKFANFGPVWFNELTAELDNIAQKNNKSGWVKK